MAASGREAEIRSRLTRMTSWCTGSARVSPTSMMASVTGTKRAQRVQGRQRLGARRAVEVPGHDERPDPERHGLLDGPKAPAGIAATAVDLDEVQLAALDLQLAHLDPVPVVQGLEGRVEEREQVQLVDLVAQAPVTDVDAAADDAVAGPGHERLPHVRTPFRRHGYDRPTRGREHTRLAPCGRCRLGSPVGSASPLGPGARLRPGRPQGRAAAAAAAWAGSGVVMTITASPFVPT